MPSTAMMMPVGVHALLAAEIHVERVAQQVVRHDGRGDREERVGGRKADGGSADEERDHEDLREHRVEAHNEVLYDVGDDELGLGGRQPLHEGETDETDEHGARPDDALQDRRHVGKAALRLEIVAEVAGAHEHVRQHDRPADGAGERIAEAGGIRHPAVRSGVGEERGDVIPELRDRLAQRAAEADDERRDNDDPEQENEEETLHRVGRGGRLDAADTTRTPS